MVRSKHRARPAPRRKEPETYRRTTGRAKEGATGAQGGRMLWRTLVCSGVFVALITLKLIMPGNLAPLRGTLGEWLVRDADFAAAFSAVGRAVSGTSDLAESLENAYVAVFGEQEQQAVAVSDAAADIPADPAPPDAESVLPLGFSFAAPLDGVVTSPYGWREHPDSGREAFHFGVDLAADEGTDITAFADGTVGVVAESTELGKYLTVLHGGGVSTLYAHCAAIAVRSGERVQLGQKLAEVGSTGNATGPHLHFELLNGEGHLDPTAYLAF